MSRADFDGENEYNNQGELWWANVRRSLGGKKGRKSLAELRDALQHLPSRRLTEGVLCRIFGEDDIDGDLDPIEQVAVPAGQIGWLEDPRPDETIDWRQVKPGQDVRADVCIVGAYIWWKRVQRGEDPAKVFQSLDGAAEDDLHETAYQGARAGLSYTLAWALGYKNDDDYAVSEEDRYQRFIEWIDRQLAAPSGVALL